MSSKQEIKKVQTEQLYHGLDFKDLGMEMIFSILVFIHRNNQLIQFYQVDVFYSSQASLQYFKVMDSQDRVKR